MTFTSYNLFMRDLYAKGAEYAAEHMRALGFSGVEFLDLCGTGDPINKNKYSADEINRALDKNGLIVDCYSVYANVFYSDREFYRSEIIRQADYAAAVGSKLFHHTIMPSLQRTENMPEFEEIFDEVLEGEKRLIEHCDKIGIECIYEPQGYYFNGVENLSRLIDELNRDGYKAGFCADLGNAACVDRESADVIDALKGYARHVHVKDFLITDKDLERKGMFRSFEGKYLYEVLPGEGDLKLGECLSILKASGYDGSVSLEYAADDEAMKASMAYIEDLWNK